MLKSLVKKWFAVWKNGDFQNMPVSNDFEHTSPYGTIAGKAAYLELVAANKDKFLGNKFVIHDEIYKATKACVRYTVSKGDFSMEVSEWLFLKNDKIGKIISYYNIPGEIRADRQLSEIE